MNKNWIKTAYRVAEKSNCMKRHVGAVIVGPNNRVTFGTNILFAPDYLCVWNWNPKPKHCDCMIQHAEVVAWDAYMRYYRKETNGNCLMDHKELYVTHYPCKYCAEYLTRDDHNWEIFYMEDETKSPEAEEIFKQFNIPVTKLEF